MSQATTRYDISYLAEGQDNAEVVHNEAMDILTSLVGLYIEDRHLTTPPAVTNGAVYVIASGATGEWSDEDGNLAIGLNGGWTIQQPENGMLFYIADEGGGGIYTGSFNFRQIAPRIGLRRSSTLTLSGETNVGWTTTLVKDGHFTHNALSNPDRITLASQGLHEIVAAVTFERTGGSGEQTVRVRAFSETTQITGAEAYACFDSQYVTVYLHWIASVSGTYIKITAEHLGGGGTVRVASVGNFLKITRP